MCDCGKPRVKSFIEVFGIWVHTKWCEDCERKQKLIDIRTARVEKAAKYRRMLNRAVPELYQTSHMCHVQPQIHAHLKTKAKGQGIYFWGGVGRGKTYIASALVRNFIIRGKIAKRIPFKDLVDHIQATFSEYSSAEKVYQRYINSDLLCIEDLGTGKSGGLESDFNQDVLLKLVDRRIEAKKTTVITSNLSPEAICDSFGSRVYSRINTFLIIKLTGNDRREK